LRTHGGGPTTFRDDRGGTDTVAAPAPLGDPATGGRTALVLGATGLVGGYCLDLLLADAAYARVVAPVRRPLARTHPRLHAPVVDFHRLEQHADVFAVDEVHACLGTTLRKAGSREAFLRVDHDYPLMAGRLAADQGARRYLLVSATGASERSPFFYSRVKGRLEAAVSALSFRTVVALRPSLLLGERDDHRPGEALAQKILPRLHPLLVGPLRRYRAVHGRIVACAMVRLAAENAPGMRVVESDEIERIGSA
jgi:uncharacterized protein YbjT (DUF2867 family)